MQNRVYLDHTYQILERVKLGQRSYAFVMHSNVVEYLQQLDGNEYTKPNPSDFKHNKDLSYVAEQFLLTQFQRDVREQITQGKITTMEQLYDVMKNFKSFASTNPTLQNMITVNQNMSLQDPRFRKMMTGMMNYLEQQNFNHPPLDMANEKQVHANDRDYIQHVNQDGKVSVLENNSQFNLREQYEQKKEELKDLSKENGALNSDTIFHDMEQTKVGVNLQREHDLNNNHLSQEQIAKTNVVENVAKNTNDSILYDPVGNIYYNERTQQVLTTEQKDGMIQVKTAEGVELHTGENGIVENEFSSEMKNTYYRDCELLDQLIPQLLEAKKMDEIDPNIIAESVMATKIGWNQQQRNEYYGKLVQYIQLRMSILNQMGYDQNQNSYQNGYQYTLKQPKKWEQSGYVKPILLGLMVGLTLIVAPIFALLFQA